MRIEFSIKVENAFTFRIDSHVLYFNNKINNKQASAYYQLAH